MDYKLSIKLIILMIIGLVALIETYKQYYRHIY